MCCSTKISEHYCSYGLQSTTVAMGYRALLQLWVILTHRALQYCSYGLSLHTCDAPHLLLNLTCAIVHAQQLLCCAYNSSCYAVPILAAGMLCLYQQLLCCAYISSCYAVPIIAAAMLCLSQQLQCCAYLSSCHAAPLLPIFGGSQLTTASFPPWTSMLRLEGGSGAVVMLAVHVRKSAATQSTRQDPYGEIRIRIQDKYAEACHGKN